MISYRTLHTCSLSTKEFWWQCFLLMFPYLKDKSTCQKERRELEWKKKKKKGKRNFYFGMDIYWPCGFSSISFPFLWIALWTSDILHTSGYNVDTEHPVILSGKPGSYFGATAEIVVNAEKWWECLDIINMLGSLSSHYSQSSCAFGYMFVFGLESWALAIQVSKI